MNDKKKARKLPAERNSITIVLALSMARIRRNSQGRLLFTFCALLVLALSTECEASIWHKIRDFLFPRRTCRTAECEDAAKIILDNLNSSVNPCEDFYDFTCGGWMAAHPVPENQTVWNQFQEVGVRVKGRIREILEKDDKEGDTESIKKARKAYRACLQSDEHPEENMRYLVDSLGAWGGWPIATENWNERKFDWKKLLISLMRTSGVFPLLYIDVTIDRGNTSNTIVLIDQGQIRFCLDHIVRKNELPLQQWITKVAMKIAAATNQNITQDNVIKDAQDLMRLEAALCSSRTKQNLRQNEFRMYNVKTLGELQQFTDVSSARIPQHLKIDWVPLLEDFLAGSGIEINENYRVIASEPGYIMRMHSVMNKTSLRTIANYMMWQNIAYLHAEVSEEFRRMGYEYSKDMTGLSEVKDRWKSCVEYINGNLEHAVGYEYVKLYFTENEKETAREVIGRVMESYIEDLRELDWMASKTRSSAVEKAENMVVAVGYPDWYNNTTVDQWYENFTAGDFHLVNKENLRMLRNNESAILLTKPFDRHTTYIGRPAEANAYYVRGVNMISIPAGIFQEPFFIKGRPAALNYGGIGTIIGHEISHAFDIQGHSEDKFGNLVNWWDDTTLNTYLVKKECVEQKYGDFPIPEIKSGKYQVKKLDGLMTVSENIADIGGLQQAYKAYKKYVDEYGSESVLPGLEEYTPEQLFFIGFVTNWCESSTPEHTFQVITSDAHTPSKYRALIPLSSLDEFHEAWSCQNSADNKKCAFW